jgi:Cft2 family RNA processing exonuclease
MTSIIKVHVFSGAHDESPPCYLLQVDEFRFLLDCGWDADFNMHFIKDLKRQVFVSAGLCFQPCYFFAEECSFVKFKQIYINFFCEHNTSTHVFTCVHTLSQPIHFLDLLRRYVHQIDAVLLSYPDHHHLGALPYMVGKCDLSCPIYATVPVYKMGQMFMYDLYQVRH